MNSQQEVIHLRRAGLYGTKGGKMGRGASRAARAEPSRYIGHLGNYGGDWPGPGLVELGAEDLLPLDDPFEDASTIVDLPLSEQVTRPIPEKLPPLPVSALAIVEPVWVAPEPSPPRPPPRQALPSRKALLAGTRRPAEERPATRRWVGMVLVVASLWAIGMLLVMAGVVAGALG
jgi:hypothetical protein